MHKKKPFEPYVVNIRKKRYIQVRNKKGRIISQRLWSKEFNIDKARAKFDKDKTLKEGVSVNYKDFTKVKQVKTSLLDVDSRIIKRGSIRKVQGFAETLIKGQMIAGVSQQYPRGEFISLNDKPLTQKIKLALIDEALENMYGKIAQKVFGLQDSGQWQKGKKYYDKNVKNPIRTGLIYYQAR